MLILPMNHPEPFAATLGVMLYPGANNEDRLKARAFAAQQLAIPLSHFHDDGHRLSYDALAQIATDAGYRLDDLDERWWGGTATGELLKGLWAIFNSNPALASWNNVVKIAELVATRAKTSGSRSAQWEARRRFLSVAHLWGAWSIREGRFETRPEIGYDGDAEFQSFVTEAEILRQWGQTWRPSRSNSEPLLPPELWQVPESWVPPTRQPGWPDTGKIAVLTLPNDLLAELKPAGRPRKVG